MSVKNLDQKIYDLRTAIDEKQSQIIALKMTTRKKTEIADRELEGRITQLREKQELKNELLIESARLRFSRWEGDVTSMKKELDDLLTKKDTPSPRLPRMDIIDAIEANTLLSSKDKRLFEKEEHDRAQFGLGVDKVWLDGTGALIRSYREYVDYGLNPTPKAVVPDDDEDQGEPMTIDEP